MRNVSKTYHNQNNHVEALKEFSLDLIIGYISKMVNVFSLLYGYTDNNNGSVAL